MPDEVTIAIASALASKGAEALLAGGRGALAALVRLIQQRSASGPADERTDASAALAQVVAHPKDIDRQVELASILATLMARDDAFDVSIRAHWQAAASEISAEHGPVVNHFSGKANNVVQAREIRGDITF